MTALHTVLSPDDWQAAREQLDAQGWSVLPGLLPLAQCMPLTVLLSAPGRDFAGGEFVISEQRPRMQSRPHVVPLAQGDAVLFAVNRRPVRGTRGDYQVRLRHGVSALRRGHRRTLGIIFHDAA